MTNNEKLKLIKEVLGSFQNAGKEVLFYCPFCKHHKHKLSVNVYKNKYKCWVCGASGNNIASLFGKLGEFSAKAKWLSSVGGLDFSSIDDILAKALYSREEVKEKPKLPEEFKTLTGKPEPTSIEARNYLRARGLSVLDIAWWKMGYCFSGDYEGRIIIPSFDKDGELNYFVARSFTRDIFPKYKNPPLPKNIVFNELYLDKEKPFVVVEGVFDAIVADNAVPLLGSSLRDGSYILDFLASSKHDFIYFALDPDARKRENEIMKLLLAYEKRPYKIEVPKEKDVGEMTKQEFQELQANAYEVDRELLLIEKIMEIK